MLGKRIETFLQIGIPSRHKLGSPGKLCLCLKLSLFYASSLCPPWGIAQSRGSAITIEASP